IRVLIGGTVQSALGKTGFTGNSITVTNEQYMSVSTPGTVTVEITSVNGDYKSIPRTISFEMLGLTEEGSLYFIDFEQETDLNLFTGSWEKTNLRSDSGNYCLRSGVIKDNEQSAAELTITLPDDVGSAVCQFSYFISSESNYDKIIFYVDNAQKMSDSGIKSGWLKYAVKITGSGDHVLKWVYAKDSSASKGEDAAFIDKIIIKALT
ncbi:MAG: hypothetical protein ACI3ZR_08910, partial [bacterium]